ncbi:MAG TPA: adenylate/guanylate cyclase domain-containing protein [Methylomirabilota bacterium]|nr:adenylate/guanylate cyclase domain-containing protein [Methylomirabilota bacterium]
MRRRLFGGVLLGLAAAGVAAAAAQTPLLRAWELRTVDLRTRASADARRADPRIVAIVIDQKSLDAVAAPRERGGLEQGWPWPRDFHAAVLRHLFASGARAVAFDLVFSERSIYTQLGVADDDAALAEAARDRPVVQAVVLTHEAATKADRGLAVEPRLVRALDSSAVSVSSAQTFNKLTPPIPALLRATAALGWIGFEPDEDGTCRAQRPAATYAPASSASAVEVDGLPLALARTAGVPVAASPGRLAVAGRTIPLDPDGRMLLRFHGGEGTYREVSFVNVLDGARRAAAGRPVTSGDEFRDAFVLVGASAAGLLDLRSTSLGSVVPGYFIHATALDNLLHGDALVRAPAPARLAFLVTLAVLAGIVAAMAGFRIATGAIIGLALAYGGLALAAFARRGVWLDLVGPVLAMALAYLGGTGYAYLLEGRARRFLRDAFSRYLAPEVVEQLVADPGRLALGGETREVTVMFADVAGFTTLALGRRPEDIVTLMNECFNELTTVIQRHGGTVDKFIGDAVMAFWNAPVYQPDHAARACRAARDLLDGVERLSGQWTARGLPAVSMRVGLATGPAVVGNVGSTTKFNYTVMGDIVNLASRLEGAAKAYGTLSLVAGATAAAAGAAAGLRELDWLEVKGRPEPVAVFELERGEVPDDARRRFAEGLAAYRARRFAEAARLFEAGLKETPEDGPAREMLSRSRHFAVHPPDTGWNGAHALTSK